MEFSHKSVLLNETIENLNIKPDGIYVDGTLGGGGHAFEVCKRLTGGGRLIGIDQDADAIEAAGNRLMEYKERVTILRGNYHDMIRMLTDQGIARSDGILLDLGVSSYQLDDASRGFTYRSDAPLDMRMDQRRELSAYTVVNTYSKEQLYQVIRDYGEEKFAENIAKHICLEREKKPIRTTGELAGIIKASIPARMRATGGHPAKRTFQAIRIEVNGELDVLKDSLDSMIGLLNEGGRICGDHLPFAGRPHRQKYFQEKRKPCICPPQFPVCVCGRKSKGIVVTRKPIVPTVEEMEENPRSKSAKLRVFEKRSAG